MFSTGDRISIWWAGLRRDFRGDGLLKAWLARRPAHEQGIVDALIPSGEDLPPHVTPEYFRGGESRYSRGPVITPRVAFTTDGGQKFVLPGDCFQYLAQLPLPLPETKKADRRKANG